MLRWFFKPIPLTEQTTSRNGLKFGMGTHFGKVFWAIEAFFEFWLRTEIWGTPRGNPQDPKISKILFSKLQYFLAEVVPSKSILIELSITNFPYLLSFRFLSLRDPPWVTPYDLKMPEIHQKIQKIYLAGTHFFRNRHRRDHVFKKIQVLKKNWIFWAPLGPRGTPYLGS